LLACLHDGTRSVDGTRVLDVIDAHESMDSEWGHARERPDVERERRAPLLEFGTCDRPLICGSHEVTR
jgi:hypothetical protein